KWRASCADAAPIPSTSAPTASAALVVKATATMLFLPLAPGHRATARSHSDSREFRARRPYRATTLPPAASHWRQPCREASTWPAGLSTRRQVNRHGGTFAATGSLARTGGGQQSPGAEP